MASQFEFFDGFGSGNLDLWNLNSGGYISYSLSGMDTYCLNTTGYGAYTIKYLTARDYYYVAFLWRDPNSNGGVCRFYNGDTILGSVRKQRWGSYFLELYRADTLIATGTVPCSYNTTYRIEVYYKPHLTSGEFKVKIDGVLDTGLNLSGVQTAASTTQINRLYLGAEYGAQYAYGNYYGRVIVASDDWVGNLKIQTLTPSAAGNYSEWSPSTGSNYQTVDEIPYNDTDYNLTNEVDKKDSFVCTDLSGTIASVKSVIVQSRVVAVGTPTPTTIKQLVRTNSSDYVGDAKTVSTVGKTLYQKWDQNPNTSSNWTTSDINNAEYGYQSST